MRKSEEYVGQGLRVGWEERERGGVGRGEEGRRRRRREEDRVASEKTVFTLSE